MIVLVTPDQIYLETDRLNVAALIKSLDQYLFTEDVLLSDLTDDYRLISLHGPAAIQLLEAVGEEKVAGLAPDRHQKITLAGQCCSVHRWDQTGAIGLHVWVPTEHAATIYEQLANEVGGLNPDLNTDSQSGDRAELDRVIKGRGIGWLAYNTARIEAGTALYFVDFGPDTLPQETGLLDSAVSFTKGCYLGQEIVARMKNLGHPKRVLVGLKFNDDRLPIAGTPVYEAAEPKADGQGGKEDKHDQPSLEPKPRTVVGGITSSTLSPMLSRTAVALAMMKWGKHRPGTAVLVPAEGSMVEAMTCDQRFLD